MGHFRKSNFKNFFNYGEVYWRSEVVKLSEFGVFQKVKFQNFLQPWWSIIFNTITFVTFMSLKSTKRLIPAEKSQGILVFLVMENLERSGYFIFLKSWQPWINSPSEPTTGLFGWSKNVFKIVWLASVSLSAWEHNNS